jgi:hypothetical protein
MATTNNSSISTKQEINALTELEKEVLIAVLYSDYQDSSNPIDKPVWYLDANDVNMNPTSLPGAIASCSKKQYVTIDKSSKNKKEHTIALTALGYRTLMFSMSTLNAIIYKKFVEYNIITEDNAESIQFIETLLESNSFKSLLEEFNSITELLNAICDVASNKFALFSRVKDANGHNVWTKFRPAARQVIIDTETNNTKHFVKVDVSVATYDNDKVVKSEKYKKTTMYELKDFIKTFSQVHYVSTCSPFFKSSL